MFKWFKRNSLQDEVEALREENLQLKAAAADVLTGMAGGAPEQEPRSFSYHRLQLEHFKSHAFTCIRAIAVRAASQELHVSRASQLINTRKAFKNVGDDLQPIPMHPLKQTLNAPNEFMTRWQLMFVTIAGLQLTGRVFWWMPEIDGRVNLYYLPPTWLRRKDGRWILKPRGTAEEQFIPDDELACFSIPHPADPLDVASTLQAQAPSINAAENINRAQSAAFANGINPSVILKVGKNPVSPGMSGPPMRPRLTVEQRQQLIATIRNAHAGVVKRGDCAIVDGMIEDIVKFSNTPAEMDFLNSSKMTRDDIYRAFGVNEIIVGATENANRAQAVVAEQGFCANTVNPLLTMMSETITRFVVPRFTDEDVIAWFEPCVANDAEMTLKKWDLLLKNKVVTPNEARCQLANLPPIDGGDELPSNIIPVTPSVRKLVDDIKSRASNPYSLTSYSRVNGNGNGRNGSMSAVLNDWLKIHAASEKKLEGVLNAYFDDQTSRIIDSVSASGIPSPALVGSYFDVEAEHELLIELLTEPLVEMMGIGAERMLAMRPVAVGEAKQFEVEMLDDFELPARVVSAVEVAFNELMEQPYWREIQTGTQGVITDSLTAGIAEGESIDQVTKRLQGDLGVSKIRATRIARTETTLAHNQGHAIGLDELKADGEDVRVEWLAVLDDDTRPSHEALNGTVIEVGSSFDVGDGGAVASFPGAAGLPAVERVNCRCTIVPVFGD